MCVLTLKQPLPLNFPMIFWQTYISALDEDLGKAQARMDGILSADGNSTSKQNEMLKAAAKQVCLPAFLPVCLSSVCLHLQPCNHTSGPCVADSLLQQ